MSEILDIIRLAWDIVGKWDERRQRLDENSWETLIIAADSLQDLIKKHEAAIKLVASPIIYDQDFASTYRRYRELCDGTSVFSSAYENAQGILGSAVQFRQFQKESKKNLIYLIRHRLGEFQQAAFILYWRSEDMVKLLSDVEKLLNEMSEFEKGEELTESIEMEKAQILELFRSKANSLVLPKQNYIYNKDTKIEDIETKDKIVNLFQTWFNDWLMEITRILYNGGECKICQDKKHDQSNHGLYRLLGELKGSSAL